MGNGGWSLITPLKLTNQNGLCSKELPSVCTGYLKIAVAISALLASFAKFYVFLCYSSNGNTAYVQKIAGFFQI